MTSSWNTIDISKVFDSSDPNIKCDIYRIIIDYLTEERLFTTAGVFQDEANMRFSETATKRAHIGRIRKLIINGEWNTCLMLISKLVPKSDQRKYSYHLHRQEYLELIDAGEHHRAFTFLSKRLKPLEDIADAQSPNELKELSYLLTCKSVSESQTFRKWKNPVIQREALAEEVALSLNRFFRPSAEDLISDKESALPVATDRLVTLLRQAVAFQILCSNSNNNTTTAIPIVHYDGLGIAMSTTIPTAPSISSSASSPTTPLRMSRDKDDKADLDSSTTENNNSSSNNTVVLSASSSPVRSSIIIKKGSGEYSPSNEDGVERPSTPGIGAPSVVPRYSPVQCMSDSLQSFQRGGTPPPRPPPPPPLAPPSLTYPCVRRLLHDYAPTTLPTSIVSILAPRCHLLKKNGTGVVGGDFGRIRCMSIVGGLNNSDNNYVNCGDRSVTVVGGTDKGLLLWEVGGQKCSTSSSSSSDVKDCIDEGSQSQRNGTLDPVRAAHVDTDTDTYLEYVPSNNPAVTEAYSELRILNDDELSSHFSHNTSTYPAKIRDVATNAIGSLMVAGLSDGGIVLMDLRRGRQDGGSYDVTFGKQRGRIAAHTGDTCAVVVHTDGGLVLSGGFDAVVNMYDATQLVCVKTMRGHTAAITSLECNRPGNLVISASRDGTVKFWDLLSGLCVNSILPTGVSTTARNGSSHDVS
eukprot:gene9082-18819_t